MSHCDSPKSLQGHWGGWRSGHLFTLGCSFCVLRPCAGKEERSHAPPVVSSSESRDCCIQGPSRPTFLQGSSGAALPCSTSHSQAHTFFMHTGATTTDTRRKQRVENPSPERQSRPCSIWEVLGQRSCSNLNVLLDAYGSIAASSTVTAHHGAQAAATAARKKIASLPLAQARSFETQELWNQGTPIPSCQPYRKFSPQQCPQREPCSPWPLWVSSESPPRLISAGALGCVLQILQERTGRKQGAFEAARSATAHTQNSWRLQELCHTCRNLPLEKQEAMPHLQGICH